MNGATVRRWATAVLVAGTGPMGLAGSASATLLGRGPDISPSNQDIRSRHMKTIRPTRALIIAAVWLLAPALASAATITITDLTDGLPTVAYSGFPAGPDPAKDCTATLESLVCNSSYPITVLGNRGNRGINLFEDAGLTIISDTVLLSRDSTSGVLTFFTLTFRSDIEGVALPAVSDVPPGGTFNAQETGRVQSFDFPLITCGSCGEVPITINLTSDVDSSPAPAPAPATLVLVGLGLAGMALSRRRHLRKS